jgi:hypothetical protein
MTKTIPYKDVNKKLKGGMKQIKDAIDLLKTHIVIGDVVFPTAPKPVRTRKAKGPVPPTTEGEEK